MSIFLKKLKKIWGIPKHILHKYQQYRFLYSSRKNQFTSIYNAGGFGSSPSLSGAGSDLVQTAIIRNKLPFLLNTYEVKSMLDIPCGDWYWLKHVDLTGIQFIGADLVDELIAVNNKYANDKKSFTVLDLVKDNLPLVDLIFCRDCLIHLKFSDCELAIENIIKSGGKWLLTTTYNSIPINEELGVMFFRPINLQLPPFNFPAPIEIINEGCTEMNGLFSDKSLGLWRIADLINRKQITVA